jgi:hypothetical protein
VQQGVEAAGVAVVGGADVGGDGGVELARTAVARGGGGARGGDAARGGNECEPGGDDSRTK